MEKNEEKTGEIVLYQPEGAVKLEVRIENETVWQTPTTRKIRVVLAKKVMCRFCDSSKGKGEFASRRLAICKKTHVNKIFWLKMSLFSVLRVWAPCFRESR